MAIPVLGIAPRSLGDFQWSVAGLALDQGGGVIRPAMPHNINLYVVSGARCAGPGESQGEPSMPWDCPDKRE
jgi:hypothetical protein